MRGGGLARAPGVSQDVDLVLVLVGLRLPRDAFKFEKHVNRHGDHSLENESGLEGTAHSPGRSTVERVRAVWPGAGRREARRGHEGLSRLGITPERCADTRCR